MEFVVSYLFIGHEDDGLQVDLGNYEDKKSCEKAYNTGEYKIISIEEYEEDDTNEENNSFDDDLQNDECDDNDADDFTVLFPNAETNEDLEEELEHSLTRMLDN